MSVVSFLHMNLRLLAFSAFKLPPLNTSDTSATDLTQYQVSKSNKLFEMESS